MKKELLSTWLLLLVGGAMAQSTQKKPAIEKEGINKDDIEKKEVKKQLTRKDTFLSNPIITLSSTSSNKAFASPFATYHFQITDPIIRALNAKAGGGKMKFKGSPIIGVPKGTYGFADGLLTLYSSGATSSGTITGNGSVGTGTSPGAFGAYGPGLGVNGKSPFTGQGPYGIRVPLFINLPDSSIGFQRKFY